MASERTRSSQSTPRRCASACENAAQPRSTASSISTSRCQGSVLHGGATTASCSGIDRRRRGVDLDDEQLAHQLRSRRSGTTSSVLSVPTTRTPNSCARMTRGRRRDQRIGMRIPALAARAPAIGEHVGVEEIGGAGAACRHGRPSPSPDRSASAWRSSPRRPAATGRFPAPAAPRPRERRSRRRSPTAAPGARRSTIGSARMERLTKV